MSRELQRELGPYRASPWSATGNWAILNISSLIPGSSSKQAGWWVRQSCTAVRHVWAVGAENHASVKQHLRTSVPSILSAPLQLFCTSTACDLLKGRKTGTLLLLLIWPHGMLWPKFGNVLIYAIFPGLPGKAPKQSQLSAPDFLHGRKRLRAGGAPTSVPRASA